MVKVQPTCTALPMRSLSAACAPLAASSSPKSRSAVRPLRMMLLGRRQLFDADVAVDCFLHRHRSRYGEAFGAHPIGLRVHTGEARVGVVLVIIHGLEQEAPQLDDRGVAHAEMLDGAVGDRADRFGG